MGLKHLVPLGARNFLRPTYQWVCRGMQKTRQSHASWKQFRKDYQEFVFRQERIRPEQPALWNERYPCLNDRTAATGFDRHYVYHTAWAARVLSETCPEMHYDISSCLYFIGVLSAFVPVRFWDYRPAALKLSSLESGACDLLQLPFPSQSINSLSCLHVLEHVGLGRYGDPVDADGDFKAMAELVRVLAPGGDLLIVVPVGKPKVKFNAHRIYSFEMIRERFRPLTLHQFSLVPDDPESPLIIDAAPEMVAEQEYGCGCFWFRSA